MPWIEAPDASVRHIWRDSTGKEYAIPPTFYEENGTPVCPESGDDMTYVRTEVEALIPDARHRYLSAEKMTQDDYGESFTFKPGELIFDAATKEGPWATMVASSFRKNALNPILGMGYGQCYQRQENGQLWMIAGGF